jgi:hypothetical protein
MCAAGCGNNIRSHSDSSSQRYLSLSSTAISGTGRLKMMFHDLRNFCVVVKAMKNTALTRPLSTGRRCQEIDFLPPKAHYAYGK